MNTNTNNNKIILQAIKTHTESSMKAVHASHGLDHVIRVLNNALHICKHEHDADLFIVEAAAWLHDIARDIEDNNKGRICHAKEGAIMAEKFLKTLNVDESSIKKISQCIATHRFRDNNPPETLEAKIIFDADKLDSIGATGIGRAFLFSGEIGARLHNKNIDITETQAYGEEDTAYREYMVKLRHVKERMQTKEGLRMAHERDEFMKVFFKHLDEEAMGKR
jgi:uncharacterized protein